MECRRPVTVFVNSKELNVSCGKCLPCLHNKRNEWSFRLQQEHKYSTSSHFITLTYGPGQLPKDRKVNKRDVQLFMKKLRKHFNDTYLRYFVVGEYGTKRGRPHYHMLLFNADDLSEKILRKTWEHGICHIGKVTQASVMYCTKYVIQRTGGFTLMSRAYGIGGRYLTDEMVAWHRAGDRNYAMHFGHMVSLPRFYKSKIWYGKQVKEDLAKKWYEEGQKRKQEITRKLESQGYGAYAREEMYQLWASRVVEKIKFTQKF